MNKKEYKNVLDFLDDNSFSNWVEQTNAADINFWEFWIANNPDKKDLVDKAKNLVTGVSFNKNFVDKEKINFEWEKLEKKINSQQQKSVKKKSYVKALSIAASILLFLSLGFFIANKNTKIVYKTNYGEILKIKLQDGSNVTLNSNSTLSYYKNETRKVKLSGEAFFQVDKKRATNAKFYVVTNDLSVEVYGTSFNVNTKKEKTDVYLQEGNIWLKFKNGIDKKMVPGNSISYSSKKDKILEEIEIENSMIKTSWKDGSLIFENLSLEKAMKKIEDTYGYTSTFKNVKSKNILITGAVPNTNIDICLKAIEKSASVTIIKKGKNLIINKK